MQGRKWLVAILVVGILIVLALCVVTIVGGLIYLRSGQVNMNVFGSLDTSAQHQEEREIEVAEGTELEMTLGAGDIFLTAGETGIFRFEMVKTAWRANQEEAEVAARELNVTFSESAGAVDVNFSVPDELNFAANRGGMDRVDFNVYVPDGTRVKITTDFGTIDAENIAGVIVLRTGFGEINAKSITGSLEIRNQNGDIRVEDLQAAGNDLLVSSSFGRVEIQGVTAEDITLKTANGSLTGESVAAESDIKLETQFGSIDLSNFEAVSLTADTSNGGVDLQDGAVIGQLTASSGFQDIVIQHVTAREYHVSSRNGKITLTDGAGLIHLRTDFGDLEVRQAENAVLDLYTGNGKIRFTGSLDSNAAQSIETSFGDIELIIPNDSSFDIKLETQFGQIRSELPVTLQGEISEKKMTGAINEGGSLLSITTQNGSITLSGFAQNNQGE